MQDDHDICSRKFVEFSEIETFKRKLAHQREMFERELFGQYSIALMTKSTLQFAEFKSNVMAVFAITGMPETAENVKSVARKLVATIYKRDDCL